MWSPAGLGNIGALGDAVLAQSCVPSPGDTNPDRVICGGITFANAAMALTWPGEAVVRNVPTVTNTLVDPAFPVAMPLWDMGAQLQKRNPDYIPAATPAIAAATGKPMGPATLVAPLPTITPVRSGRVDENAGSLGCSVQSWASANPSLALLAVVGVYFLVRGSK